LLCEVSHSATDGEAWQIGQWHQPGTTILWAVPCRHLPLQQASVNASNDELMTYFANSERWRRGEMLPLDPTIPVRLAPYWSHARTPAPNRVERVDIHEDARGWPLRTLLSWELRVYDRFTNPEKLREIHSAIDLKDTQTRYGLPRRLPLCPIWPGFAINTLFYAGILWMLFAAPFALRRRRRVKRGLCPACAYPVGESDACTECGRPFPPPLRAGVRGRVKDTSSQRAVHSTHPLALSLNGGENAV
jgi:hypothetical protein